MLSRMWTRRNVILGSLSACSLPLALKAQASIDPAIALIEEHTRSGLVTAASLYVQSGATIIRRDFGKAPSNAVYLLASITKPMTATAVMLLAENGQLALTDPVRRFIPEFRGGGREQVLIRHLLTHTSGLPDMLPENTDLRKRHAPLPDFVAATCKTPLLFAPGSEVRYQSMGILLAAEIASRASGQALPAFLQERVFQRLGMGRTSLGLGGRQIGDTMTCQVDERNAWDWNSPYWRNLASPWGGAHATAEDVAAFLRSFGTAKVLKRESATAMLADQTTGLKQRWGLGWRLNDGSQFGKACSARTFGHGGSTGTLCWRDPDRDRTFVLLTTRPSEYSGKTLLHPVSEIVAAWK